MSGSKNIPRGIETDWTVWVSYTVQPGARLSDLLGPTTMTKSEWTRMNPQHPASKPLKAGDEILIKDPIATCERAKADLMRYSDGVPLQFFNYQCESTYSAFKPLKAFVRELRKK